MVDEAYSDKSRLGALLFCLFLGVFGAHRFYVGKHGTAILTIFTFGGFGGIWPVVDAILIIIGSFRDKQGRRVMRWLE
jgi:TM2 domain-containing membrane protein YozV